jgi:hypothetical protein
LDAGGVPVGALLGLVGLVLSVLDLSGYVLSFERCAERSDVAGRSQAARPSVNSAVKAIRMARFTDDSWLLVEKHTQWCEFRARTR